MLKIEKYTLPDMEWMEHVIEGMRNPMNSWDRMDTTEDEVGVEDYKLMRTLAKAGPEHRKFMRMMPVLVTITAPLYWWKQFDTYKVGTDSDSCSTMHKIHAKKFELNDFSLDNQAPFCFQAFVNALNLYRSAYLATKSRVYWKAMIQLLPSSYNQKRTVMLNYEVLANICRQRKGHKIDEWKTFIDWAYGLPYAELFSGEEENDAEDQ